MAKQEEVTPVKNNNFLINQSKYSSIMQSYMEEINLIFDYEVPADKGSVSWARDMSDSLPGSY